MRLFNCKVRLSGSLLNEVRKYDVTAAEITILRVLHNPADGEDSVSEIKTTGKDAFDEIVDDEGRIVKVLRTEKSERARLEALYGNALRTIDGVKNLNGVFGVSGKLPETIEGIVGEVIPDQPIVRTKVEPKAPKKDALAELEARP